MKNKLRKEAFIVVIVLLFCSCCYAESVATIDTLSDEQLAYYVYSDISVVYSKCVDYLNELCRLFELVIRYNSIEDWNYAHDYYWRIIYNDGNDDGKTLKRSILLTKYMKDKGIIPETADTDTILAKGPEAIYDLYTKYFGIIGNRDITDVIKATMFALQEIRYLSELDELNEYYYYAKSNMQVLRKRDAELFSSLIDYFKDASNLLDFLQNINASYLEIKEMSSEQNKKYDSYVIDFDFLFGDMDYDDQVPVIDLRNKRFSTNDALLEDDESETETEDSDEWAWFVEELQKIYPDIDPHTVIERAKEYEKDDYFSLLLAAGNYSDAWDYIQ